MATDPKKIAQEFCLRNACVTHFFESISAVTENRCSGKAWCVAHKTHCTIPVVSADVLCAGFPCAPYSKARPQRHQTGRLDAGVQILQKALAKIYQSARNSWERFKFVCDLGSEGSELHLLPSWAAHAEFKVLLDLLSDVRRSRPRSLVLENVTGLRQGDGGDCSPLEMLTRDLEAMEYAACSLELDMSTFHPLTRQRILVLGHFCKRCS
eukprot:6457867-Amphidinium_carterae.1